MKNLFIYFLLLATITRLSYIVNAQPVGFYNGTEGKTGDVLKQLLHDKIKNHVDFSYNQAKYLINYSDADPNNSANVILFYSQISRNASLYGTGAGYINREHVWAKSHGNFSGIRPMDGDALNLRPEDGLVNENRGNFDFDNVQPNGTQDATAIGCWYNQSAYEPGPLSKGQVARILFYMATRYEGTNGEIDLELISKVNNYPLPKFGNLTTLLEWNNQYPPSAMERQRNERIFRIQQNRNPFVDHPEFANYIWGAKTPTDPEFGNFSMLPEFPSVDDEVAISLSIKNTGDVTDVRIFWGNTFDSETHQINMVKSGDKYNANLSFSGYKAGDMIYFKIQTTNSTNQKANFKASYLLPEKIQKDQLTAISVVQGNGMASPLVNQKVTISGRVTANFDNSFYIQTGNGKRSGVNIYNTLFTGKTGDSLVITGVPAEYNDLTEITNISSVYNFKSNKITEPVVLTASQVNEDYEGMLVQINNVTFDKPGTVIPEQNMSYIATDKTGSVVIYINLYSRLVRKTFPSKATNIVGIVSQYQGVYQILPRDLSDFKEYTSTKYLSQFTLKNMVVFPNPANDLLNIQSDKSILTLRIMNLSGRVILVQEQDQKQIPIQNLTPGVYILEATFENGMINRTKFCKF
jgi:endonuclease I/DNA/RNA endonuclease YhcR with UshA esterase domain